MLHLDKVRTETINARRCEISKISYYCIVIPHQTIVNVNVTQFPSQTRLTNASEFIDAIDASGALHARHRFTFVYVDVAIFSRVSGRTDAFVIVNFIDAGGIVSTRHRQTLVEIQIASFSCVTGHAIALETSLFIDANAVVANRHAGKFTFVDVLIAQGTCKTSQTYARGRISGRIYDTRSAIFARIFSRAGIDIETAILPFVSRRTLTFVFVHQIHANLSRWTNDAHAIVHINLTLFPFEAGQTVAAEFVFVGSGDASAVIETGFQFADVIRHLTDRSHPIFRAVAVESIDFVDAKAAV